MNLITDVYLLQGLRMSGTILVFTHTPSWCAQELFFICVIVMVGIFIVIGLHVLDVMAYRGCAVEN